MEREYIQLPPIPADLDWDVVKVIWEFAKLSEDEREKVHSDLGIIIGGKDEVLEKPKNCREIEPEEIEDYVEALRGLIAALVKESSDIAAWVFARKYINGCTLEEMLEEMPDAAKFIEAMDIMFEKSIRVKEDSGEEQNG